MNSLLGNPFIRLRAILTGGMLLFFLGSAIGQTAASSYSFTHLAGPLGGPGSADGRGANARFWKPNSVAVDMAGNAYVADMGNHTIRKIAPNSLVTTFAGKAGVAGSADGTGSAARFNSPSGIAVDQLGNVYVADANNGTIRKITPGGMVTTLSGVSGSNIALDSAGNIYGWTKDILVKMAPNGSVTALAGGSVGDGTYSGDGLGSAARFFRPGGIAVDAAGNVYLADTGNHTIRKVTSSGVVTTLAGIGSFAGGYADGVGSSARFKGPTGVAVDGAGNVYVAEGGYGNAHDVPYLNVSELGWSGEANHTIRKITPNGTVTTLAGTVGIVGSADGIGGAAQFDTPQGLAVDSSGNIFVADLLNDVIRRLTSNGAVTTLAGAGAQKGIADGTGSAARFTRPSGVALDGAGNVYVTDSWGTTIRKITPDGAVTTLAGKAGARGDTDGTGAAATLDVSGGMAVDFSGNVFVRDNFSGKIRKITPGGVVTPLSGEAGNIVCYSGLAVDAAGNLYAGETYSTICIIAPNGTVTRRDLLRDFFHYPPSVAIDLAGNLYLGSLYLTKVSPAGAISNLSDYATIEPLEVARSALLNGDYGARAGYYPAADRFTPRSIVAGDFVWVADYWLHTIMKFTADGAFSFAGGAFGVRGCADGIGTEAQFNYPSGVAIDKAGNLYVADTGNNAIRKGVLAGPPVITTQPLSQTVTTGTNVQFAVTASGAPEPTYQWFFNGSAFSAATTNTLSFANARSTDAGDYSVVVTNSAGSITSTKATLTVSATPSSSATAAPTPPPSSSSGGGGAINAWFVLALLTLVSARRWRPNHRGA